MDKKLKNWDNVHQLVQIKYKDIEAIDNLCAIPKYVKKNLNHILEKLDKDIQDDIYYTVIAMISDIDNYYSSK